jgi:hypothetical protein
MKMSLEEARKRVYDHDKEFAFRRPSVPGEALEYCFVPPMGFMLGRLAKKGQVIRIIVLEGQQCFDAIIWDANNFYNVSNCWYTLVLNKKWDKFRPGDGLYSRNCDRLAIISDDTTDGRHAFVGAFCGERLNWIRYGIPGTINCHDNFVSAMKHYGLSAKDIDWGSCYSFFMPVLYNPDGSLGFEVAPTKPGDYIDLATEMDIVIAISNCPSMRHPVNAFNPSSLQVVVFNPDKDYGVKIDGLRDERDAAYRLYPARESHLK